MNTSAIEKYSTWARTALMEGVRLRLAEYALTGKDALPADTQAIAGRPLTAQEQSQRAQILRDIERMGEDQLVERTAASWFNRLVEIRDLEVHDRLPSRTRILSDADGRPGSQAVAEALDLEFETLPTDEVLALISEGDDEALFRRILIAQCDQLAGLMPQVFEHVGAASELLLPRNLRGADGVATRLVTDIPLEAWDEDDCLGWFYQFYVSERKREVFDGFKKKKKAGPDEMGPATQLFTPDWIVSYMVQNSLGRLWMLNHPESGLRDHMDYYIEPEGEVEDFCRISSPEEIRFIDPACGSAHILVAAFDLLFRMYEESGYLAREIPSLILANNLTGFEIDSRAADYAVMSLVKVALKHDRRFLKRGVMPNIRVFEPIEFTEDELEQLPGLAGQKNLVEALAHLGEVGSLLNPTDEDLAMLESSLVRVDGSGMFSADLAERIGQAIDTCKALRQTHHVCVANPPYMGSGNFTPWMGKWTKKNYKDSCKDLCTCFIERGFDLVEKNGYSSMVTMQSWMFLGSFQKVREKLLADRAIVSMAHLGTRAFDAIGGEVVSTTATVFLGHPAQTEGSYVRLVDFDGGSEQKRTAYLEAIRNHDYGWFYRADSGRFHDVPGSPILYWASKRVFDSFKSLPRFGSVIDARVGLITGDVNRFLKTWPEVSVD